jgi:hypothetical protein
VATDPWVAANELPAVADEAADELADAGAAQVADESFPVSGVSVDDAEMVVGSIEPTAASGAPIASPAMIPIDDEEAEDEADSDAGARPSAQEPPMPPPEEGGFYERRLSGLRRRIEAAEAEGDEPAAD